MKLISNYNNFSLKKNISTIIKKKNFNITLLISLEFLLAIILLINHRKLIEAYKYTKNINLNDIKLYFKDFTTAYDFKNEIKNIDLQINFKNISKLDCLRQRRNDCGGDPWARGEMKDGSDIYPVKLKAKGDRDLMHRGDLNSMSFKVDIRGEKRFLGMEEFSIQLPIIRNYTSELLVSKVAHDNNIVTGRNSYIKLYLNGKYQGLRHIEETSSRELIESSKRRYGPIFSLQETVSTIFGESRFDLADKKFWDLQKSELSKNSLTALELAQRETSIINKLFDQEKWASYFALMDTFLTYHGSVPKSVKFYLNPTKGKFEPIFYDGHHALSSFTKNFLLSDFIQNNKNDIDCGWICRDEIWYKAFFDNSSQVNKEFYSYYFNYLNKFSSKEYENKTINKIIDDLSPIRGALYREFSPYDGIFWKGDLPHIYKLSALKNRLKYIRGLIAKAKNNEPFIAISKSNDLISITNQSSKLPQIINIGCNKTITKDEILVKGKPLIFDIKSLNSNCNKDNIFYTLNNFASKKYLNEQNLGNLDFKNNLEESISKLSIVTPRENIYLTNKNTFINKNLSLINKKIILKDDSNICLSDSSLLKIENSEIISLDNKILSIKGCGDKPGSIYINNSKINLNKLNIAKLSKPNEQLKILYSGLNIIDSDVKINLLNLSSSKSEDAINFIDSDVKIKTIIANKILSDAIDSDASNLKIDNIICNEVLNDCLDLSYSQANVGSLEGSYIKDKAVSVGEASTLSIKDIKVSNSEVGLVVKDSSKVLVDNIYFSSVKLPVATYIKKAELGSPFLKINSIKKFDLENSLISNDSKVFIGSKLYDGKLNSKVISKMLYGNIYGTKTKR